eukprot:TRINITY_DN1328_c0_g1_i1.p1 TRINITY_DN1328_c0_g1~~TRINITY_DN1328_c0_g1_i1.p1  ORF type:complete len:1205 (+),score=222.53 TRINITY_DN1328_c0_g1_i1:174-3788(+)
MPSERGNQRPRRATTAAPGSAKTVQAAVPSSSARQVASRASVPAAPAPPWDPWASSSEDEQPASQAAVAQQQPSGSVAAARPRHAPLDSSKSTPPRPRPEHVDDSSDVGCRRTCGHSAAGSSSSTGFPSETSDAETCQRGRDRLGSSSSPRPNPLLARNSRPRSRLSSGSSIEKAVEGGRSSSMPVSRHGGSRSPGTPGRPNPLLAAQSRSPSVKAATPGRAGDDGARVRKSSRKPRSSESLGSSVQGADQLEPVAFLQSLFNAAGFSAAADEQEQQQPAAVASESKATSGRRRSSRASERGAKAAEGAAAAEERPADRRTSHSSSRRKTAAAAVKEDTASVAIGQRRSKSNSARPKPSVLQLGEDSSDMASPDGQSNRQPEAQVFGRRESSEAAHRLMAPWDFSSETETDGPVGGKDKNPLSRRQRLAPDAMSGVSDTFSFQDEPAPPSKGGYGASAEIDQPEDKLVEKQNDTIDKMRAFSTEQAFSFSEEDFVSAFPQKPAGHTLYAACSVPALGLPEDFAKSGSLSDKVQDGKPLAAATHVKLPRVRDLPTSVPGSAKSCKATAYTAGLPVQEYGHLLVLIQVQQALGFTFANYQETSLAALSLARWYLPLLVLPCLYLIVVLAAGGASEAFLFCSPLFLLLPGLQLARVASWDRQLLAVVDEAVAADVRDQLRAPFGWGDEGQVFSANLAAALQAVRVEPGELLMACPRRTFPARPFMPSLSLAALLLLLRLVRLAADIPGGGGLIEAEVALLALSLVLLVAVDCRPSKALGRPEVVDLRLEALESAFNAMLDTLRPLLGQRAQSQWTNKENEEEEEAAPAVEERFAVRLLTAERQTIRGTLRLVKEEENYKVQVTCPLASFDLCAWRLEGTMPTEFGRSAAGDADVLSPSAPGPAERGGLLPAWASSLASRLGGQSPQRRARADDEDLASVSTASTLKRDGKKQVDEASLHLALAMVNAMNRRQQEPLEVFRAVGPPEVRGRIILPPKVALDEPGLVLALAEDRFTCAASRPCASFGAVPEVPLVSRCFKPTQAAKKELPCRMQQDRLGLVREPSEMRALCGQGETAEDSAGDLHSLRRLSGSAGTIQVNVDDSPRSWAASIGSGGSFGGSDPGTEDDELSDARPGSTSPKWPLTPSRYRRYSKIFSSAPRHLALVFDSWSVRDRCMAMLRERLPSAQMGGTISTPDSDGRIASFGARE